MTTVISGSKHDKDWDSWVAYKSKKSVKTGNTYYSGAKHFLCTTYNSGAGRGQTSHEQTVALAARYIGEVRANQRNVFDDLVRYVNSWGSKPSTTMEVYVESVISFLNHCCDVTLDKNAREELRGSYPKGSGIPQTKDGVLNREKLKRILMKSPLKLMALILVLASSGIRIGEALKLTEDDLKLAPDDGSKPDDLFAATVTVRAENAKEGQPYQSFISAEAVAALKGWLNGPKQKFLAEERYKRARNFNSKHEKGRTPPTVQPSEDHIFPITYTSASLAFVRVLKAAGLFSCDKTTQRSELHLHSLRKFFMSTCQNQGVPEAMVQEWVGHAGYLGRSYRRWTDAEQVQQYHKAEPALTVMTDSASVEALLREKDTRMAENADLIARNGLLLKELATVKAQMTKWEAFFLDKHGKELGKSFLNQNRKLAEIQQEEDLAEFNQTIAAMPVADKLARQQKDISPKSRRAGKQ